jgi:hypothetical protein
VKYLCNFINVCVLRKEAVLLPVAVGSSEQQVNIEEACIEPYSMRDRDNIIQGWLGGRFCIEGTTCIERT